ncbi:hypothetical protein [uncultured Akkermansia sp.]|uniref:hypothetical protein n=1 Tax=uncultured Akkermansia sp. TaxID=512294 RepID=UPI0025E4BA43|nr:hypothetical protein [uncultured Akkermansia sp.]
MNKRSFEDFFRMRGFDLSRVHHLGVHNPHTNIPECIIDVKRIKPNQNDAVIWKSQSDIHDKARTSLGNPQLGVGFKIPKPYTRRRMEIVFSKILEMNDLARNAVTIHLMGGTTIQLYLEKTYHYL